MSCFHRRIGFAAARRFRAASAVARDERGAAALEGIIVVAILVGMFCACLLLGQWGNYLQSAQMGARLLAFDAGDNDLAKLGKPGNQPVQTLGTGSWDSLFTGVTADWLTGTFTLSDTVYSGTVTGTAHGRVPGSSRSLVDYAPATMGYGAKGWASAFNPWRTQESIVRSKFVSIAHNVSRYQVDTAGLVSMTLETLPGSPAILETIFGRVGIR